MKTELLAADNLAAFGSEYFATDPTHLTEEAVQFQEIVRSGLLEPRVLEFSDIAQQGSANPDKSVTQNCVETIQRSLVDQPNDRFYVDSAATAELVEGRNRGSYLSRTSIGETSAHQVFFTNITGGNGRLRVAVKPFKKDAANVTSSSGVKGALVAEWANTLIAAERGFGVFRPLGFVVTSEGGFMMTVRRDGLEPMDNANWAGVLQDVEGNKAMLDDLSGVGPLLARLHDRGGAHRDPQMKNFVLSESSELKLIDWESAVFNDPPVWGKNTEGQEDVLLTRAKRDMKVVFDSLARSVEDKGVGFLDGLTPDAQWSFFKEYIMTPYINERITLLEKGNHPVADQAVSHLGDLESVMQEYITTGELYKTLARARNRF